MKLVGKILLVLGILITIGVIIYFNIVYHNPQVILMIGIVSVIIGLITIIVDC